MDKFVKTSKDLLFRGCYCAATILLLTADCGSALDLPWLHGDGVDEHRRLNGCADCPWEVIAPIGADMSCFTCNSVILECMNNFPDIVDAYGICFPVCGSSLTEIIAFYQGLCGDNLSTVTYNHVVGCWAPAVPSSCTTDDTGGYTTTDDFYDSPDPTPGPITPTPAPITPTTPAPVTPVVLTRAPVTPTPAPVTPTSAPITPTPAPVTPTPAPITPTPAPTIPTPAPITPTPAPVTPVLITPTTPGPVSPTPRGLDTPAPTSPVLDPPAPIVEAPAEAPTAEAPTVSTESNGVRARAGRNVGALLGATVFAVLLST